MSDEKTRPVNWRPKKVHSLIIGTWETASRFAYLYSEMKRRHTDENGFYIDSYSPNQELIHTYYDWHLIPTSRPVIVPPEKHEETFEIPGMDFFIDTSEALTGYPTFSARSGSIEFVAEEGYERWLQRYSDYLKNSHGKHCKIILEDDLDYYYEGFFYLNEQQSGANFNTVTFDYVLEPYKMRLISSTEDWIWDPFNFENGVIYKKMVTVDGKPIFYEREITAGVEPDAWENVFAVPTPSSVPNCFMGKKPVVPYITAKKKSSNDSVFDGVSGIKIEFLNQDVHSKSLFMKYDETGDSYYATSEIVIPYGSTYHDELIGLIFTDQTIRGKKILRAKGWGYLTIEFRGGEL